MGVDPFLFSDALLGVLGQRLARRLCSSCRKAYEPEAAEVADLEQAFGKEAVDRGRGAQGRLVLYRGQGCPRCRGTGYRGRIALHELLVSSPEIRVAIQQRTAVARVRELAGEGGMTRLAEDGFAKAVAGLTDPRQVLAVCS